MAIKNVKVAETIPEEGEEPGVVGEIGEEIEEDALEVEQFIEGVPNETATLDWGAYWLDDLSPSQTMTCTEILWDYNRVVDIKSESLVMVPELVIDSGAASTVVGRAWLEKWCKWGNISYPMTMRRSTRKFRFGSGTVYDSLGNADLKGWVWTTSTGKQKAKSKKSFGLTCDVVDLPIPLLVSLNTLRALKCQIHFGAGKMVWSDGSESVLRITMDKHLSLEWYPKMEKEKGTLVESVEEDTEEWADDRLHRLHIQLGHADVGVLKRVTDLADVKIKNEQMVRVVQECGCLVSDGIPQPPRISKYIPNHPGEVIAMDIYYPNGEQKNPAILCVDALTRYVASKFLPRMRPRCIISLLITCWIAVLGVPTTIMVDMGTPFSGADWELFSHTYGVKIVAAPTRAHYQLGLAERNSALIKTLYMAQIRENPLGWSESEVLALTCLARNLSPSVKTGLSPLHLLTGRNDMVARLLETPNPTEMSSGSNEVPQMEKGLWCRIQMILKLRENVTKEEARQIINLSMSKI